MSRSSRSKCKISVRGPAIWNEFLTDSEYEIKNILLFKNKAKSMLGAKCVRDRLTRPKWCSTGSFTYYNCTLI